ncbi:MAG: response regulator [Thermoproteota archaeon]|nr:response regulator [Thermoproteota archaeon]
MSKRVLIIDDEPDIILTLRMALEQNGFRTDSYSDSILAYKNFRAGVYDLVLLDIKMPNVDGFQLYQKIKRKDSRVKICFLTASEFYDEEIRKEQGFEGFNEELFLKKPVEIACLIDTIRPLMDLAFN